VSRRAIVDGGVPIELGTVAYVFDLWSSRPVFHAFAWRDYSARSRCGRALNPRAVGMPPRHALAFARPCRTCWPELRGEPRS
jgi:hypothetical protein